MKIATIKTIGMAMAAVLTGISSAWAAPAAPVELTPAGKKLEAQYAAQLEALKADIAKSVPTVDKRQMVAYQQARDVEKAAEADRNAKQTALNKSRGHGGLLKHRQDWIGRAVKGVAEAKEKLEQAEAMTGDQAAKDKALAEAREALAKIQENHNMAASELKKAQALVDQAKIDEPRLVKELEAAQKALALALANTQNAVKALGLEAFLTSDKLDAELATYIVLSEGTPAGLAAFAQQGKAQEELIKKLLVNEDLMLQMAVADDAKGGQYGRAMEIYTAIQKASRKAGKGTLQRLALAISLEHAVPLGQRNPTGLADAPATIDPVKRYFHYEKAYLADELDPAFEDLSTWDYRFVVDGNEPDETLAWGREMLRNYRPDHITTDDYRWRYVAAVRTDIRYGSQYNKLDKPELQFFQNTLMNGGVCGRRAFFGRFMLRSFGIPTTARPQPGHAALVHWTPEGWVVCLGGGWGIGHTKTRYNKDRDFLANTQARDNDEAYMQVKRAQWMGNVMDEIPVYGFLSGTPGLWYGISLYKQREIIEEAEAVALAAVGTELGEANESDVKYAIAQATMTEADKKVSVGRGGVITIPASACSNPTKSTGKIIFMQSVLGGKQLHSSRTGKPQTFEYTFDAPKAGNYALTARVVTPTPDQLLAVAVNGAKEPVAIALPFTVGMWDKTAPVKIALKKGKNVLTFSRAGDDPNYIRGLTIKDFSLAPVK